MLRVSPVRGYAAGMLQTDHDTKVKLSLPPHVAEVLTGWAVFELQKTPEEVLEALAEELVGNEQLRAFAAGLSPTKPSARRERRSCRSRTGRQRPS